MREREPGFISHSHQLTEGIVVSLHRRRASGPQLPLLVFGLLLLQAVASHAQPVLQPNFQESDGGTVRRVAYLGPNNAPIAALAADRTTGIAPLTVQFSAAASSDPDGDPLT